jgi:hypothetical protein
MTPLDDHARRMNNYWRMLAGLITETRMALDDETIGPEARLTRIEELIDFVSARARRVPASVVQEDAERITIQDALRDSAERERAWAAGEPMLMYRMGDDGAFHEEWVRPDPEPPLSETEGALLFHLMQVTEAAERALPSLRSMQALPESGPVYHALKQSSKISRRFLNTTYPQDEKG